MGRLVEEIVKKVLNKINEERGISDEVEQATNYIISHIVEWSQGGKEIQTKSGVVRRDNSVVENIFGQDLRIDIILFIVPNEMADRVNTASGYDDRDNSLHITAMMVDGQMDYDRLYETIQHEVHHCYQKAVRGDKPMMSSKNEDMYNVATMKLCRSKHPILKRIGSIIYLSSDIEQEAFANGLYSMLSHNTNRSNDEVYSNSMISRYTDYLKESCDFLNDNTNDREVARALNFIRDKYGINLSPKKLTNMCNKAHRNMLKKSGKVLSLVNDRNNLQ